jgi:hypothetical protein
MTKAMAGNFMATVRDTLNNKRMLLGDTAKDEEGRFAACFIQPIEQQSCIALNPAFTLTPFVFGNGITKGAYVVVVFQIDGESVSHCLYNCTMSRRSFLKHFHTLEKQVIGSGLRRLGQMRFKEAGVSSEQKIMMPSLSSSRDAGTA